jgi:hypothetical protein
MRHKIYLLSILLWRLSAIDQINDVGMGQAASQEHICVLSAQSMMPLSLHEVPWPDVCDRYCQVARLLLKDSLV